MGFFFFSLIECFWLFAFGKLFSFHFTLKATFFGALFLSNIGPCNSSRDCCMQ